MNRTVQRIMEIIMFGLFIFCVHSVVTNYKATKEFNVKCVEQGGSILTIQSTGKDICGNYQTISLN